jgi:hypothetical protein
MNPSIDKKKKQLDEPANRLIKLPSSIWQMLDNDAHRCRRSTTKQIEAILAHYYELDDVALRDVRINETRIAVSPRQKKSGNE